MLELLLFDRGSPSLPPLRVDPQPVFANAAELRAFVGPRLDLCQQG